MPRIDPPMIRPREHGEIVIGGPSGVPIRLPAGVEGSKLTVSDGSPTWIVDTPTYTQAEIDAVVEPLVIIGTEGQVLATIAGEPQWTDPIDAYTKLDIDNKLLDYAPTVHEHTTADVQGLDVALGERSLVGHVHQATEIQGLEDFIVGYVLPEITPEAIGAAPLVHTHAEYSLTTHNHDAAYAPIVHDHDADYAAAVHTHLWGDITDKPATFTPSAHDHDGVYVKPADLGDLAVLDTVAVANIAATGTPSSSTYLRGNGTWATPTNTTYTEITSAEITTGTASTARTISGRRAQEIVVKAQAGMATSGHNHDETYAPIVHNHDGVYVKPADLGDLALEDAVSISDIVATGTPSGTNYLRGDGTWAVPEGSGSGGGAGVWGAITGTLTDQLDLDAALDAKADIVQLSSYLTSAAAPELIRDTMNTALVAGANVTITPNDAGDTVTIAAAGSGTNLTSSVYPYGITINSDTGTDAELPPADGTNAGLFLPAEKTKLAGIAAGAEVNVQSDWNAASGDAQILNKPATFPPSAHNHDAVYAPIVHTHAEYAPSAHNHDADYAPIAHSHDLFPLSGASLLDDATYGGVGMGDSFVRVGGTNASIGLPTNSVAVNASGTSTQKNIMVYGDTEPTLASHLTRKDYVDGQISSHLHDDIYLSNGVLTNTATRFPLVRWSVGGRLYAMIPAAGSGGDYGVDTSSARSDHLHDARYPIAKALANTGPTTVVSIPSYQNKRITQLDMTFTGLDPAATYIAVWQNRMRSQEVSAKTVYFYAQGNGAAIEDSVDHTGHNSLISSGAVAVVPTAAGAVSTWTTCMSEGTTTANINKVAGIVTLVKQ